MKRLVSLIIVLIMVLGMMPAAVYAEGETPEGNVQTPTGGQRNSGSLLWWAAVFIFSD